MSSSLQFNQPKDSRIFQDNSENWLSFRKIRFNAAGDGEYATIKGLDLSSCDLGDFPADHLAFIECNLDGVSFKNTIFSFNTAFINCSMKNTDLTHTIASDALFLNCNLEGIKISAMPPYTQWTSKNLDGNTIYSIFSDCIIDESTKKFLLANGCLLDENSLNQDKRLLTTHKIAEKLDRINVAPVLDL
jgi:uncharacterized protein YjbI with pentapeptide repeats